MDSDRLKALCRAYYKRDFTGWHECRHGRFLLDCGGYSIVYDGSFHVRILNRRFEATLRINHIRVDLCRIRISYEQEDGFSWELTTDRERERPRNMPKECRKVPYDSSFGRRLFYDRSWPEVAEYRPVRVCEDPVGDMYDLCSPEMGYGKDVANLVRVMRCEDVSGLVTGGRTFDLGPITELWAHSEVLPRDPSDIRCSLHHHGDGWEVHICGYAEVGERARVVDEGVEATVLMTPCATSRLEGEADMKARATRKYLSEHPPEDRSGEPLDLRDCGEGDGTYPLPWDKYWAWEIPRVELNPRLIW